MGDADCISNGEINIQRRIPAQNYNMLMGTFFWLSDNEVPVDVRRPTPPDAEMTTTGTGVKICKWILMGLLPLLLLVACLVIWIRRKGR